MSSAPIAIVAARHVLRRIVVTTRLARICHGPRADSAFATRPGLSARVASVDQIEQNFAAEEGLRFLATDAQTMLHAACVGKRRAEFARPQGSRISGYCNPRAAI
jgi:hypothetical protein